MSRKNISFIDTSVLMYILDIDTGKQPHDIAKKKAIKEEYAKLVDHKDQEILIMPITTIIETGNHIAHIPNKAKMYKAANRFKEMLEDIFKEIDPWMFYGMDIQKDDLNAISISYIKWTETRTGLGDQTIIYYYQKYFEENKAGIHNIRIWSTDKHLSQFYQENIEPTTRHYK